VVDMSNIADQPQDWAALTSRVTNLEQTAAHDKLCMCIFSGELDRQLAALILATSAAASGMEVHLFFTFWATASLRDPKKRVPKSILGRLFGWMLPSGSAKPKLSQLQMLGMGPPMLRHVMKKKGVASTDNALRYHW